MKIKVSEAEGAVLDWMVLVALHGKHDHANPEHVAHFLALRGGHVLHQQCHYSTDWAQGGPIIEREGIDLLKQSGYWAADSNGLAQVSCIVPGPTPLIAAMRCYVANKLGDEVDVPEELR